MMESLRHPYIIAEMACSHDGDVALGKRIVEGAGAARADAIQFQIWDRTMMVVPQHPDMEALAAVELTRAEWRDLYSFTRTRYPGMQVIACVYERASVDFAEELGVDAYKLHSSDLSNPMLIDHVAATGKRIDLSVGASSLDEITAAVTRIRATAATPVWLMYGFQRFPTPVEAIHLRYLRTLHETYGLPVGYQDHSDAETKTALWLPAAALGMGVRILEKHITHDRASKGADHQSALNPDEFAEFAEMVKVIDCALGSATPRPFSTDEMAYRTYSKKSLVAAKDLSVGHRIEEGDLAFMRAEALGLPPSDSVRLIGRTMARAVEKHRLIRTEDVK